MPIRRHSLLLSVALLLMFVSLPSVAQVVTATLPVGTSPSFTATNTVTNTVYVANELCTGFPCTSPGSLTVIDGATNVVRATLIMGINPGPIAVNSVTNKIYVANTCGNDSSCQSPGTVTVVDGNTLATQTVNVGYVPNSIVVNPVTNMIYVANSCLGPGYPNSCEVCATGSVGELTAINGNTLTTRNVQLQCAPNSVDVNSTTNMIYASSGSFSGNDIVSAIDGTTFSVQTVPVGIVTINVAVDATANKIYASNVCSDPTCQNGGTVTVIDGATLQTQDVAAGVTPYFLAVNPNTGYAYVANLCRDTACESGPAFTVINGSTLSTTTLPVCNAGAYPAPLAVNSATNKVYLPCIANGGSVAAIDGATNAVTPIAVGDQPSAVAVNSVTNTAYIANYADSTISVIGGATKLQFATVTPCRLVDTRTSGIPIYGGTYETFDLATLAQHNNCADLSSAVAVSLNVTLVPQDGMPVSYLTIWPTSQIRPLASTMNSLDGRIKANAAILPVGINSSANVYVTNTADVVLDLTGYFTPASAQTLQFYPLPPCRVADTRKSNYPQGLGQPYLSAGVARDFPVLESPCIPQNVSATAYSFNVTAIPYPTLGHPLAYLEVWPTGNEPAHRVSTLNNPTGTYVANAAIVEAGNGGAITAFGTDNTDLAIDIDGYFAPARAGGQSFYPTAPCRVIDTRKVGAGDPFTGTLSPPVDVVNSPCNVPAAAQGFVFNATVVPPGYLGYLTLWPDGEGQPVVSTLNAADGMITSNMAIVPNMDGKINAYAAGLTQLILDISGYFAP